MNPNTSAASPTTQADSASSPQGSAAVSRVHHLFRATSRAGKVHPLQRIMLLYRTGYANAVPGHDVVPPPGEASILRSLDATQVRRCVAELPPLPKAALRALQTVRKDDVSLETVAATLDCDASLTARVLRLANSPFYGVPGRVVTARAAAQVLGRRTLESLLTLASMAGQLDKPRARCFDTPAYWRHSLATAIAARALAKEAGLDEDQTFVAGLLHDIGLLAMSVYFPDELDALLTAARDSDVTLCTIEQQQNLTSHALVGSWIATHWNFPADVAQAIAAHHAPQDAGAIAICIHVASAIGHALDLANLDHELVPEVDPAAWAAVAPNDDVLCSVFAQTEEGVTALCAALAL